MPELPDLVHVAARLSETLRGRRVQGARIGDPVVLRMMVPDAFPAAVVGARLLGVERRGHFLRFETDANLLLVVNAMLVGRYALVSVEGARKDGQKHRDPASLMLALLFEGGIELRYSDEKRMGKVYVVRPADELEIPIYGALGVDPTDERAFTPEVFRALLRGRRDQVRNFLMDKEKLASIGNAYADEILFAAHIHPKTFCHQLKDDDGDRLFDAIRSVLRAAIDEIRRRDPPIDEKLRDFVKVRGRDGQPCPACGSTIRTVRVGAGDACFCPRCQPATRKLFIDWK